MRESHWMFLNINRIFSLLLWAGLFASTLYLAKALSFAIFLILWLQYPLSMNQILAIKLKKQSSQKLIFAYQVIFSVWLVFGLHYFVSQTNAVSGVFSIPSYSTYSLPFWGILLAFALMFDKIQTKST